MRAVIAAAQNLDSVCDLYYSMREEIEAKGHIITYSEVQGLQVTVVYEMVEPIEQPKKKERKQPTRKQLQAKAEKLFLNVEIIRNANGLWQIRNDYGSNEVFTTCKTALGISRKLTAMHCFKQITKLKNEGVITA